MEKSDLAKLNFTAQVSSVKTYGWYEFSQNNSGGIFQIDDDVSVYVLIQAASPVEANTKAKEIGIYFDGCQEGLDCDCCGDRWHEERWPMEGFSVYRWKQKKSKVFDNVRDYAQERANEDIWAKGGKPSVVVYFADGSKELFYKRG